jgi:hypothetical protein
LAVCDFSCSQEDGQIRVAPGDVEHVSEKWQSSWSSWANRVGQLAANEIKALFVALCLANADARTKNQSRACETLYEESGPTIEIAWDGC